MTLYGWLVPDFKGTYVVPSAAGQTVADGVEELVVPVVETVLGAAEVWVVDELHSTREL